MPPGPRPTPPKPSRAAQLARYRMLREHTNAVIDRENMSERFWDGFEPPEMRSRGPRTPNTSRRTPPPKSEQSYSKWAKRQDKAEVLRAQADKARGGAKPALPRTKASPSSQPAKPKATPKAPKRVIRGANEPEVGRTSSSRSSRKPNTNLKTPKVKPRTTTTSGPGIARTSPQRSISRSESLFMRGMGTGVTAQQSSSYAPRRGTGGAVSGGAPYRFARRK
jgi:hypothetical protein